MDTPSGAPSWCNKVQTHFLTFKNVLSEKQAVQMGGPLTSAFLLIWLLIKIFVVCSCP